MGLHDIADKVEGVWLPKHETHLREWMTTSKGAYRKDDRITYQWAKQKAAMEAAAEYIPDLAYRSFVDVGAHVGLWSMWWAEVAGAVIAFEPIPDMRLIYTANMVGKTYTMIAAALGEAPGEVDLVFNPANTGNTHAVKTQGTEEAGTTTIRCQLTRLDDAYPSAAPVPGVVKIDCEGAEAGVVRGGLRLLQAHRPLVVVEQKKGAEYFGADPEEAVTLLKGIGYRVVRVMSGDYIMVHGA